MTNGSHDDPVASSQRWVGVREFGRLARTTHGAVQKAIASGRIPAAYVRRGSDGSVEAVEAVGAALAWRSSTDPSRGFRHGRSDTPGGTAAMRMAAQRAVQKSATPSGRGYEPGVVRDLQLVLGYSFATSLLPGAGLIVSRGGVDADRAVGMVEDVMIVLMSAAAEELGLAPDVFGITLRGDLRSGVDRRELLERIDATAKIFAEANAEADEHG